MDGLWKIMGLCLCLFPSYVCVYVCSLVTMRASERSLSTYVDANHLDQPRHMHSLLMHGVWTEKYSCTVSSRFLEHRYLKMSSYIKGYSLDIFAIVFALQPL